MTEEDSGHPTVLSGHDVPLSTSPTHFKIGSTGFEPPPGEVFHSVEASKGELGYYIICDGSNKPFRFRVRTPSFANLSALPEMIEGQMIADVIATIGSIDIVLGEIDR